MSQASNTLIALAVFVAILGMHPEQPLAQSRVETHRPVKSLSGATRDTRKPAKTAAKESAMGCLIEPSISSQVAASAPGVLTDVKVERGDRVKQGQVIAILDSGVEQAALGAAKARARTKAQIATARASRDMARKKYQRVKKLKSLSYGAQLELDLARGELSVADHRLQQAIDNSRVATREHKVAQKQLEQRLVRSPINGIVADRLLNPGERADGRPIVRVIQLDKLRVEVILPATQFGKVKPGMDGTVTPAVPDADSILARVVQVDRFIDPASGTFRARLAMNNAELKVPAGVRCDVSFRQSQSRPGKG